ncbi:MAG: stage V sporulation protein AC [Bacillota bacterium]
MENIDKSKEEYKILEKKNRSDIPKYKNLIFSFIIGGIICLLGQIIWEMYINLGFSQEDGGTMTTITLIFLGSFLTGIGVYDEISQYAGAGTIVPVTGFANAMVAPALEYKQDGYILGMGAKLFSVAGPVLSYGMLSAFIIGLLKYIFGG